MEVTTGHPSALEQGALMRRGLLTSLTFPSKLLEDGGCDSWFEKKRRDDDGDDESDDELNALTGPALLRFSARASIGR